MKGTDSFSDVLRRKRLVTEVERPCVATFNVDGVRLKPVALILLIMLFLINMMTLETIGLFVNGTILSWDHCLLAHSQCLLEERLHLPIGMSSPAGSTKPWILYSKEAFEVLVRTDPPLPNA